MKYVNALVARGILDGNNVVDEISSTLSRLRNTYGSHCVDITPLEVQVFLNGVYQRGPVLNSTFFPIETINLQIGKAGSEPNFWVAKIAVVVDDITLHKELEKVQHGDGRTFTAQT